MFDIGKKPYGTKQWQALADAVLAEEVSESFWLELKTLDFSNSSHLAKIAKSIIGFANRDVAEASKALEGHAILLLGIDHGVIPGVEKLDVTDLENKLSPFLSQRDGPRWEQNWFEFQNATLLAITVAAPQIGDRIYSLQSGSNNESTKGQVIIRRGSATVPAEPEDLARLALRTSAQIVEPSLDIDLSVRGSFTFPTITPGEDRFNSFIAKERERLLSFLPSEQAKKPNEIFKAIANSTFIRGQESRSESTYRQEVEDYLSLVAKAYGENIYLCAASVLPAPAFLLTNLSDKYYEGLRITLQVGSGISVLEKGPSERSVIRHYFPKERRVYGASNIVIDIAGYMRDQVIHSVPNFGSKAIRKYEGGTEIILDEVELRSRDSGILVDDKTAFLIPERFGHELKIHWTATAARVDAFASGTLTIPVADAKPFELSDLLPL